MISRWSAEIPPGTSCSITTFNPCAHICSTGELLIKEPDVICAFVTTFGLSSRFHEVRHCAASLYETTLGSNGIRDISNNRQCFFLGGESTAKDLEQQAVHVTPLIRSIS